MKKYFIFFISISTFTFAQKNRIDSLLQSLKSNPTDTQKVNILNCLCLEKRKGDINAGITFCKEALDLAKRKNFYNGMITAYTYLAIIEHNKGNYDGSLKYADSGFVICEKQKLEIPKIKILNLKGNIYGDLGDVNKGLQFYLNAVELAEKHHRIASLAGLFGNIGTCFMFIKQYEKAKEYFRKGITASIEGNDMLNLGATYNNLGSVFVDKNQADSALYYFNKAEIIYTKINYLRGLGYSAYYLGATYFNSENYPKALTSYLKAANIYRRANSFSELPNIFICISQAYQKLNELDKALDYAMRSLNLAEKNKADNDKKEAFKTLKEVYYEKKDYKKAIEYYTRYIIIKDSLIDTESTKQMAEMQTKYETKKKEQQITLLNKEGELNKSEAKRQRIIIESVVLGLVLMGLFAGFIFRSLRITRKQKQIIEAQKTIVEKQKHIVEEHQKEIIDSITYAKRLQQAILPSAEEIKKYLPDNFLLYKPKAIVAGDFYWMEHVDNVTFFAAADSTGHGVPGAMVSVVCSNALNRAVKEFGLRETGKILDKTRELVLETFAKSSTDVKDGMDISLLSIDKNKEVINWSGANNQLWYISNNELKEITPDKQPIGKTENPKPFTTNHIEFVKGDIYYLMTDGFPDQFGGPKGKKYKYKKLADHLLVNCDKILMDQKNILEKNFNDWKGDLEQVDDVTMIGIKL